MAEEVQKSKAFLIKYKNLILLVIGVLFTSIGLILLGASNARNQVTNLEIINYTDCMGYVPDKEPQPCIEEIKENGKDCYCTILHNLTNPLVGQVTLYYEFSTFNQTSEEYIRSRDNIQLSGVISKTPSENCKPFQYDIINGSNVPIVPCGAIADSMFTDDYILIFNSTVVPLLKYGILSEEDKGGFKNPKNWTEALQNSTKPKSWTKSISELDPDNEENNGFQNEAFISWMRTDWKRKPIARVNHTNPLFQGGLPAGQYSIAISFSGISSKYEGPRNLILESKIEEETDNIAGTVLLVIGLLTLFAMGLLFGWKYLEEKKKLEQGTALAQSDNTTSPNEARPLT